MAQYPARLLINRAWNLSGIVARGLENVSGQQGDDGLFLLNEVLEFKAASLVLIPYYKRTVIQLIQGVELYPIPNLYQVETFTFAIGDVRFPTMQANRTEYFGSGRVNNIQALPFSWHLERTLGGSNFRVYFLPNSDYLAEITGKFALTDVTMDTDLTTVYDGFYIAYLRYCLAQYMSMEYDLDFGQEKEMQLKKMEKQLMRVSPPDLTVSKISFINDQAPFSWAHINISPGYFP